MRRMAIPGLVAVVAIAVLALLVFGVARNTINNSLDAAIARGIHPLAPAAKLRMPMLGSKGAEDLADLRGKVVVVNVFASWCPPCAAESGVLERTEKEIAPRNATVLGVTHLDAAPNTEQFVKAHGITYPVVRDVDSTFAQDWGATGVPETYVVDRHGRVAGILRRQVSQSWLDSTLAPLLAQPS